MVMSYRTFGWIFGVLFLILGIYVLTFAAIGVYNTTGYTVGGICTGIGAVIIVLLLKFLR